MTREIAAYILLLAILLGALFNTRCLDRRMTELKSTAEQAFDCLERGDGEKALKLCRDACDSWEAMDSYTHIFIRHDEIGATSDAFFDFLSDISEENIEAAYGSLGKLCDHLDSMSSAEHLSLGSIF